MRGYIAGLLLVYSAISLPATGYVMQEISNCGFGDDKQGNVTFQYAITLNHLIALVYDPASNQFINYAPFENMSKVVSNYIEEFTTKLDMLSYVKSEEKRCKDEIQTFWDSTVERSVTPSMEVFSPEQFNDENLPVLICFVWGFYPPDIAVAWIKNDMVVVKNETQAVRAGDWTYQVVLKLDLRDSLPEDNYTCIVEHASLNQSMITTWKHGLTSNQIMKISVAAVIFGLGLINLLAGFICWKNAKKSGYTPIPGYNDFQ
ncbi:HLA class II histocompatibility antigen, DM beta chain [Leptodactylus fuscus]|uniref:HLA class II histocompatibility antigen, DM beta chain n=1 Tax=Leptodactylus fuscus TaxID=238119 RepID=UPI003F4F0083